MATYVKGSAAPKANRDSRLSRLTVAAVGVVFGDIGTSPIYMMREAFAPASGLPVDRVTVLGVLSLVFWALTIVVTLKYVALILRADNRGEGGVLALAALVLHNTGLAGRHKRVAVVLAILGAALFYGDGVITPSISVLSAVEGLEIATSVFRPVVVPIALAILVGLFVVQHRGTARVGALFGPLMLLWFVALAVLGICGIVDAPEVLQAVNPAFAITLFVDQRWVAFAALGSVVLAVTGAEALYADMGHFGRQPIRVAWFVLVLPSLFLNYFGQGALLLTDPAASAHPFFRLAPDWALYPLVLLSTCATIIASQAVISGVFSLTSQAVHLGYLPRLRILHTSEEEIGQIYLPEVNWLMLVLIIAVVLGFGSSSALAGAYGVAVTAVMMITTVLAFGVFIALRRWNRLLTSAVFGSFLGCEMVLFAATTLKIPAGGWFPILVAAVLFVLIATWRRGRAVRNDRFDRDSLPLSIFIERICAHPPTRVPGTSIFLTGNIDTVPLALLHNIKHNKVLHERVVMLKVLTEDVPRVPAAERSEIRSLPGGFYCMLMRYGFMDRPAIPRALKSSGTACGPPFEMADTTFFVNRERLILARNSALPGWQGQLYVALSHVAQDATEFFMVPSNRVVELGVRVEI